MRAKPLLDLLNSVQLQSNYPDEILIVDGSTNDETKTILEKNSFKHLIYFKVDHSNRGLTKQRNFGISNVSKETEIVCFLDDDTILEPKYFEEILKTYAQYPEALGVGGYITNEITWKKIAPNFQPSISDFCFDGWTRKEGSRNVIRKKLRLDSHEPPCFLPPFSHGRSVSYLPPSDKIYPVEQFMGGVSSFKKSVFEIQQFSNYFEGYGLYEDADFTLRLSKIGKLFLNTSARLAHYHDGSGRPNKYAYGKMVIRNGWYVWRVKYPKPSFNAKLKWNAISLLLIFIRFTNIFSTNQKKEALTECLGRTIGWISLLFNKPKIKQ